MFDWTDAAKAELKTRWQDGESASQIATAMNVTSRSSVIGKVHRMGLAFTQPHTRGRPPKPSPKRTTRFQPPPTAPQPPVEPVMETNEATDQAIPIAQRRTLVELEPGMCRWPVGTPGHDDFFFCAAPTDETYCPAHHRRAYKRDYANRGVERDRDQWKALIRRKNAPAVIVTSNKD